MPKYKIIDNFLDPDYYQLIVSHFLGDVDTPNVQWNYERDMSGHQHSNITKYTGNNAVLILVAKAEFAQSYIYQPKSCFREFLGKSFILVIVF